MESYKRIEENKSAKDFYPIPLRDDLSNKIILNSKEVLESNLSQFAQHYCSLTVDGYSKRSRKLKAFVISFPQYEFHQLIKLSSINNFQVSFAEIGASVIDYCKSLNLNISTVNTDGYGIIIYLKFNFFYVPIVSQCAAFSLNKDENYLKFLKTPLPVKIFHSKCCNHLLKQCIDELIKENEWLLKFEKIMLDQIVQINKNDKYRKEMHGRGDTNYQTRWLWRSTACDYIRANYESYKKIFNTESLLIEDLCLYGLLFEGAMGLHRMYERNSSSVTMLFYFDLQYFEYVEKLLGFCYLICYINFY
jgi:hypothetical protein